MFYLQIIITEGIHLSVFRRDWKSAIHNKPYMKALYRGISAFLFGCAVTQLSTDIAKYSIGRLRPHYLTLCKPTVLANCSALTGYIQGDVCTNRNTDDLLEARSVGGCFLHPTLQKMDFFFFIEHQHIYHSSTLKKKWNV